MDGWDWKYLNRSTDCISVKIYIYVFPQMTNIAHNCTLCEVCVTTKASFHPSNNKTMGQEHNETQRAHVCKLQVWQSSALQLWKYDRYICQIELATSDSKEHCSLSKGKCCLFCIVRPWENKSTRQGYVRSLYIIMTNLPIHWWISCYLCHLGAARSWQWTRHDPTSH